MGRTGAKEATIPLRKPRRAAAAHRPGTGRLRERAEILRLTLPVVERVEPQTEEHSPLGPAIAPLEAIETRERAYRRLLGIADGVAYLVATIALALANGNHPTWGIIFVPLFAVFIGKVQRLYDRDETVIHKASIAEWRQVLQTAALTSIGIYLGWRLITDAGRGPGMRVYLGLAIVSFTFSIAGRVLAREVARALSAAERCVIIGSPRDIKALSERLHDAPGVDLIGAIEGHELNGSVAELRAVVDELDVHRLVIAPASNTPEEATLHLIQAAKFIGVRVSLLPSIMTAVGGVANFDELDGLILLGVPRFGLSRSSLRLKRAFDIVVGGTALVVLSPIILGIALCIRLDSRGPVLFRQERIGRGGQPFKIFKFRSMVNDAEARKAELLLLNEASDGLFKIASDPRITRVGRHIRSSHLDELPQLLNVIRGEMSLVGPRPLVKEEDDRVLGRDRHRIHLTPGMTGPWQIRGPMNTPLSEMAKLDYMYASRWSIWEDVDILLKTAVHVFNRDGH